MAKGVWIRVGNCAVPADPRSLEFLQAKREGEPFMAETKTARNIQQHRMWWALCSLVAEAYGDVSSETVSEDLRIALGYTDSVRQRDGGVKVRARSMNFESMNQEEFAPMFKLGIEKVAEWLASEPKAIRDRYNEIVADKRYRGVDIRW